MGTGQNYTKTKLHEVTKLHEDTFARRQICTRNKNGRGTKLHEDNFALRVNFAHESKKKEQK